MSESEKRIADRVPVNLTSFVRRTLPEGGTSLMQFVSKDLSVGGIFIVSDDLSILDLGEEVTLLVDQSRNRYYEGQALVVRSAREFADDGVTESGFGLMFAEPPDEFRKAIEDEIARSTKTK